MAERAVELQLSLPREYDYNSRAAGWVAETRLPGRLRKGSRNIPGF